MTPSGAEILRLKHVAPAVIERLDSKPIDMPFVALENIESKTGKVSLGGSQDSVEGGVSRFRAGDVLFGKLRPYLAKVASVDFDGVCSTELVVLRPQRVLTRFLQYCLLTPRFIDELNSWTFGSKMPRVSPERLMNSEIRVPSKERQHSIIRFLDARTARIDKVIEEKQELVKLLESMFPRCVDNELDPPTYKRLPLKRLLVEPLAYGILKPDRYVGPDSVPVVRIADVANGAVSEESLISVTHAQSAEFRRTILKRGDVVVSVVGTLGRTAVIPDSLAGANVSRALARVAPKRTVLESEYLRLLFNGSRFRRFCESVPTGTAQRVLNLDDLREFAVPVPSLEVQGRICRRLGETECKIREVTAETKSSVETLKEYRSALITAAVTGQLDVGSAA